MGGGQSNIASAQESTVAGGASNQATGLYAAVGGGLAGLGAGLAVSDVVSVRYPQRVPETRSPFGGGGAGQGCAAGLVAMALS